MRIGARRFAYRQKNVGDVQNPGLHGRKNGSHASVQHSEGRAPRDTDLAPRDTDLALRVAPFGPKVVSE